MKTIIPISIRAFFFLHSFLIANRSLDRTIVQCIRRITIISRFTCLAFQIPQLQLRGRVQSVADAVSVSAEPRLADELATVGHVAERREEHRHVSHRGVLVVRHVQDTIGHRRKCAPHQTTTTSIIYAFIISPPSRMRFRADHKRKSEGA